MSKFKVGDKVRIRKITEKEYLLNNPDFDSSNFLIYNNYIKNLFGKVYTISFVVANVYFVKDGFIFCEWELEEATNLKQKIKNLLIKIIRRKK